MIECVGDELKSGVDPEDIVYTSFTRAAATEARDRALRQFVGQYHAEQFIWFSTIHSICFRRLGLDRKHIFTGDKYKEFCDTYGYAMSANNDNYSEDDNELQDMVLQTDANYFEYFINWYRHLMLDFEAAFRQFMRTTEVPEGFTYDRLTTYISRRNNYKSQFGLWDFCDMLEAVLAQRITPGNSVKVVISDESQDLSPLLSAVLNMWVEKVERHYISGDPYQCLYRFGAADPTILINMQADKTITLKQSHRCARAVHDLSRVIVRRMKLRYPDDDFMPTNNDGQVVSTNSMLIKWDNLINRRVFYLHRTHWLLSQAYDQLVDSGVPFMTLHGRPSPLQSNKAKTVHTLYSIADDKHVHMSDIADLMEYVPLKIGDTEYIKYGTKVKVRDLAKQQPDSRVFMVDLYNLGFTQNFVSTLESGDILRVMRMSDQEHAYLRRIIKRFGYKVLQNKPSILLSTIHGTKGMEADVVIVNQNLTRKTYEALNNQPDDEHRVFYVAVTRAKDKVILLQPDSIKSYWM